MATTVDVIPALICAFSVSDQLQRAAADKCACLSKNHCSNETTCTVVWCSSTTFSALLTACLRDLARHFRTDPTETVLDTPKRVAIKGTTGNNAIRQQKCDIPLNSQLCCIFVIYNIYYLF
jgi:hypothetical protein